MKDLVNKYGEIIRYLIIGVLTTIVSLAIYYGLTLTILDVKVPIELQIANILSWIGAVIFAYFTNKYYVFKNNNKDKKGIIKFFSSRIITLLIDMFLMYIFVTRLSFNDKIIKILVQIVVVISNYVLSKFFVFKKTEKWINYRMLLIIID